MRHRKTKHELNKPADQRKAMMRNLATSLFLYGSIETTEAKANALVSYASKLITKIKKQDEFNAIRELKKVINTEAASIKAMEFIDEIKKSEKNSGFVQSVKVRYRAGDAALMKQVTLLNN